MSIRSYNKSVQLENYKETEEYKKLISSLEKKIESQTLSSEELHGFSTSERTKPSKQSYAIELKKQIEARNHRKELERLERMKPAISEDFHGYPNLPQTPPKVRRQRELDQMNRLSQGLTEQLALKNQSTIAYESLELERARKNNILDVKKYQEEQELKQIKKDSEKQILLAAWGQAHKAKELQNLLEKTERKGIKPLNLLQIREDEGENKRSVKKEDESLQVDMDIELPNESEKIAHKVSQGEFEKVDKKKYIKEKAQKLKEYLDKKAKGTYQYKIKKLIQDAKNQREKGRNNLKKT
ncbi:hypothetical protein SteCoe_13284 [Stentor coeruleus]|uniref:Uncharacterized protein n=1 Tax=Stentor coeruleus TaxID=5963 RepID=A0A1R2C8X8_9CILI|nr:hypothetical protein SteCoe_13284 [Stentor coeruleus]